MKPNQGVAQASDIQQLMLMLFDLDKKVSYSGYKYGLNASNSEKSLQNSLSLNEL
jgi:hypothetical protein